MTKESEDGKIKIKELRSILNDHYNGLNAEAVEVGSSKQKKKPDSIGFYVVKDVPMKIVERLIEDVKGIPSPCRC